MTDKLMKKQPATKAGSCSALSRVVGALLRPGLRLAGIAAYHAGLARHIINLSPERVRTLLYHEVDANPGSLTRGLGTSVSPAVFRTHLDYFQRYYNVSSIDEVTAGTARQCALLITFDDGYKSVYSNAAIELESRGMPATVYLISRTFLGEMVWVNRINQALNEYPVEALQIVSGFSGMEAVELADAIQRIQVTLTPPEIEELVQQLIEALPDLAQGSELFLTEQEVLDMQKRGFSFGFHSRDHYNLQLCSSHTLDEQLDTSEIAHLLNTPTFAYPFGYCGDREANRLAKKGYKRIMLVNDDTPTPRVENLKRSEPSSPRASHVFAEMEVVTPVLSWLKNRGCGMQRATNARLIDNKSTVQKPASPA